MRKQEPTIELNRIAIVHGWQSKKTPYMCEILPKQKIPACIPPPRPRKLEQQQPTK